MAAAAAAGGGAAPGCCQRTIRQRARTGSGSGGGGEIEGIWGVSGGAGAEGLRRGGRTAPTMDA